MSRMFSQDGTLKDSLGKRRTARSEEAAAAESQPNARPRAPHEHSWHVLLWEGRPPCLPTNHLARITRRKTGRHGGRPSPNFSAFLAGRDVHVAPEKPDRLRKSDGRGWPSQIVARACPPALTVASAPV